jgi:gamma-glutamylcyclotransferase (GGCT)/AIG2-like uncharacterized protein YtfP
MSGMSLHDVINDGIFIGEGLTKDYFSMHISGLIPFLHDEKEYHITGELYDVADKILKEIDQIEMNGEWYIRKQISIDVRGCEYIAYAYINNEKGEKLDHGDYRLFIT